MCNTPQPRLVAQKTFFLLSCLGEKGGSPFMPSRVWCKRGLGSLYLCLFPLRSFYLFSLLTPVFFVSLIGLTDHSSFTQRGGKGVGKGQAVGYQVEIPGNQYYSKPEEEKKVQN